MYKPFKVFPDFKDFIFIDPEQRHEILTTFAASKTVGI